MNPLLSSDFFLSLPDQVGQSSLLDHPVKPYDDIGDTPITPAGEASCTSYLNTFYEGLG